MNAIRIYYRTRQFWQGLRVKPTTREIDRVRSVLNNAQFDLFLRMQPVEQSHSLAVFDKLSATGEADQDLLVAALLHDVGKTLYPLKLWERTWIVLGKGFFPGRSKEWALGDLHDLRNLPFWKRPFVVAKQHPQWGANLAAQIGLSQMVVSLICRHQESWSTANLARQNFPSASCQDDIEYQGLEDCLLQKLQAADDES
jgi:putative nucleotidyltransferase with HDIG domain